MTLRQKKVILIGAEGYERADDSTRVDCFGWTSIGKIKNIRDYDTLIINVLGLKEDTKREQIDWECFCGLLDFHAARDILQHDGEIIVVGDPRFHVPTGEGSAEGGPDAEEEEDFLNWTDISFRWDDQPGDTIDFVDDYKHRAYEEYVRKISKWEYSLYHCEIDKDKLKRHWNLDHFEKKRTRIVLERDYFCRNRYGNALAFSLRYQFVGCNRYNDRDEIVGGFGPMIFLPRISLGEDETLLLVLRDICGIEGSLPEPEWISEFSAPGQKAIDDEIRSIKGELENTADSFVEARERRAEARKCLKLLYEREYGLEPVVRDVLRGLGAHVEDPEEENKEDGWVVVKVLDTRYEGVLEIKSTRSDQFGEDGRKQLLDWIDRGRTLRGTNYKGIFIGSSAVDKPIKERKWAFSDSWTKAAELSGICAMKTEDLYVIYLLKSRGVIDLDSFWRELFETKGVFNMKKYWEMIAPKDGKASES